MFSTLCFRQNFSQSWELINIALLYCTGYLIGGLMNWFSLSWTLSAVIGCCLAGILNSSRATCMSMVGRELGNCLFPLPLTCMVLFFYTTPIFWHEYDSSLGFAMVWKSIGYNVLIAPPLQRPQYCPIIV